MKKENIKKVFITKCPKCGSRKYFMDNYGIHCPDCEKGKSNQPEQNKGWKEQVLTILRETHEHKYTWGSAFRRISPIIRQELRTKETENQ